MPVAGGGQLTLGGNPRSRCHHSLLSAAGMAMAMKMAMAGNVQARLPAAYQGQPGWAPTRSSQNILTEIIEMIYTGNPGPDTRGHAPMSDDALCTI